MAVHMGDEVDLSFDSVAIASSSLTSWSNDGTYANANSAVSINVEGEAEFDNDIKVDGLGIVERLNIIELVLGLPERDVELEEKHPHLKDMYLAHVDAITKVKEVDSTYTEEMAKLRTFEILNKDND